MFELPDLEYSYNALEPFIDAKTMEIHHSKHHKAYVDNLNKALEGHENWQNMPVEALLQKLDQLPENIRAAVRNNGGGHYNHSIFWKMMTPKKDTQPSPDLLNALNETFGSLEAFKEEFSKSAVSRFGSGWGWLALDENKKFLIYSTPNQDTPISDNKKPLLTVDVWEHAYYLKYQNRRPEYLENWWNVVNWDYVSDLYAASK